MGLRGQCHPPGIAQWSTPNVVVISGGLTDRRPSVAQAYAAHGSRVLHTANTGAVHVRVAGGHLELDQWRDGSTRERRRLQPVN